MLSTLLLALVTSAHALDPAAVVGSWNITLTATYSTCDNVKVGDILAQQWVFSAKSGHLEVQVLGAGSTSASYAGDASSDGISLHDNATPDPGGSKATITVDLTGDATAMTGRRVVSKSVPCTIMYDVTAKHQ